MPWVAGSDFTRMGCFELSRFAPQAPSVSLALGGGHNTDNAGTVSADGDSLDLAYELVVGRVRGNDDRETDAGVDRFVVRDVAVGPIHVHCDLVLLVRGHVVGAVVVASLFRDHLVV